MTGRISDIFRSAVCAQQRLESACMQLSYCMVWFDGFDCVVCKALSAHNWLAGLVCV